MADYKTPYDGESRTEKLRYQKKYFPDEVREKGALLTEKEIQTKLLEEHKDDIEMQDNIGGG